VVNAGYHHAVNEMDAAAIVLAAAEGIVIHRIVRHGLNLPDWVALGAAVGIPALMASGIGAPALQTAIAAGVGGGGSLLYDELAGGDTTFLFFSDTHGRADVREAVIAQMMQEPGVSFVVFGGDAVSSSEEWAYAWDRPTAGMRDRWTVYAARGNHDDHGSWEERFPPTPYKIDLPRGTVYVMSSPSRDSEWVARDMQTAKVPIVVCLHYSPLAFSDGNHGQDSYRRQMQDVLARADVVLTGHEHVLGMGRIGSCTVMTAGIAGSKFYNCLRPMSEGVETCDGIGRGYLRVTVGDVVTVTPRMVDIP